MPFKSNALSSQLVDSSLIEQTRIRSWGISLGLHALGATLLFLTIFSGNRKEKVELTVLEMPAEVPTAKAPPIAQAQPKRKAPSRKAIFGASPRSSNLETDLEVKAGNTVAKAPDAEKLRPEDEVALPVPADEIEVTQMPKLLSEVRVPYPAEAKRNGVQGAVVMDLLIDANGNVRDVTLIEGPEQGLNEAAMSAVRQFRFSSAYIEAKAVAVKIRYAYRFVLER